MSLVTTDHTIGVKDLPKEAHKAFKAKEKKQTKQEKKDEQEKKEENKPEPAAEKDDLFGDSNTSTT